jgi:hypothetical protein
MNKEQVFDILSLIKQYYDRFEVSQMKINAWHDVLEPEDFNAVYSILKEVVKTNKFPPTIAEIMPTKQLNGVMGVEETRKYLDKLEAEEKERRKNSDLQAFPKTLAEFKKMMAEKEKNKNVES